MDSVGPNECSGQNELIAVWYSVAQDGGASTTCIPSQSRCALAKEGPDADGRAVSSSNAVGWVAASSDAAGRDVSSVGLPLISVSTGATCAASARSGTIGGAGSGAMTSAVQSVD